MNCVLPAEKTDAQSAPGNAAGGQPAGGTGTHAARTSDSLSNDGYMRELISLVLEKTEGPDAARRREVLQTNISRDRLLLELISGENIEYAALPTKPGWEENLFAIRIPLRKGLQGYRLLLIDRKNQEKLSRIDTLDELRTLPMGAGRQWSSTKIMKDAGFPIVAGESKSALIRMLDLDRFTIYPRGVDEVFHELEEWQGSYPDLAVEQTMAIHIPFPIYMFVTPKRPDLAERFERGLRMMIADGSFDRHFWKHYRDDIERAGLDKRKIFRLSNPNLSAQTPLDDASLWLNPAAPAEESVGDPAASPDDQVN